MTAFDKAWRIIKYRGTNICAGGPNCPCPCHHGGAVGCIDCLDDDGDGPVPEIIQYPGA